MVKVFTGRGTGYALSVSDLSESAQRKRMTTQSHCQTKSFYGFVV